VTPIDDALPEPSETVVVHVVPSPLLNPVLFYRIGTPAVATVTIADNDGFVESNHPPVVKIIQPYDGTVFRAPANIRIAAEALDIDGLVVTVGFFAERQSLGIQSNAPMAAANVGLFTLLWSNVPPGQYALTAQATDNRGGTAISPPVRVLVVTNGPPRTNGPVLVDIV